MTHLQLTESYTYDDVLLIPQYSDITSRSEVSLDTQISPSVKLKFPVCSVNMDTITGIDMAVKLYNLGGISFFPRFKTPEGQLADLRIIREQGADAIPAIGIKSSEFDRAKLLFDNGFKTMTIDVAHGHQKTVIELIKRLRESFTGIEIIAGVVASYSGAYDLFMAGADSVRVGVGPGTICTTRRQTGSGVPQITAIYEANEARKEFQDRYVIADGGTKYVGDIVKALAIGADAVAVGSQFAGTDVTPGDIVEIDGKHYKAYNGSTSETEKKKQFAINPDSKSSEYTSHIEGVESYVEYKGSLEELVGKMSANLRSGFTYSGARNIPELHAQAKFTRVSPISAGENGAHGVLVK